MTIVLKRFQDFFCEYKNKYIQFLCIYVYLIESLFCLKLKTFHVNLGQESSVHLVS